MRQRSIVFVSIPILCLPLHASGGWQSGLQPYAAASEYRLMYNRALDDICLSMVVFSDTDDHRVHVILDEFTGPIFALCSHEGNDDVG